MRSTPFCAMPCTFQNGLSGWTLPSASVARDDRIVSPGVAFHVNSNGVQEYGETGGPSAAGRQVRRSSVLTSTLTIGAKPDHALPTSGTLPAETNRIREIASGNPGGLIRELTHFS